MRLEGSVTMTAGSVGFSLGQAFRTAWQKALAFLAGLPFDWPIQGMPSENGAKQLTRKFQIPAPANWTGVYRTHLASPKVEFVQTDQLLHIMSRIRRNQVFLDACVCLKRENRNRMTSFPTGADSRN